jgi:hypothetical protein
LVIITSNRDKNSVLLLEEVNVILEIIVNMLILFVNMIHLAKIKDVDMVILKEEIVRISNKEGLITI